MIEITQQEIEETAKRFPGDPIHKRDEAARAQWLRWRIIATRVISNPHYRFDDPKKAPLLKMAAFAADQMGHFCTLTYRSARPIWEQEFGPRHAPDSMVSMLLREDGVRDDSWHNDIAPHLSTALSGERRLELWWAPANKARRETPDYPRYMVVIISALGYQEEELYAGEDTDLAVAIFRSHASEPDLGQCTRIPAGLESCEGAGAVVLFAPAEAMGLVVCEPCYLQRQASAVARG